MADYATEATPIPQMLSRWYLLFLGMVMVVFGVAGLAAASALAGDQGALSTTSIIWLVIALIALAVGFFVRNANTVRWTAGILGALFLIWGIFYLFSGPQLESTTMATLTSSAGSLMVLLGSLGVAAAIVPAYYLYRERNVAA